MAGPPPAGRDHEEKRSGMRGTDDWSFDQTVPRKSHARHWTGMVRYLTGPEGERLRDELSAAIHDLLRWAAEDAAPSPDALRPGEPDSQSRFLRDP